MSLFGQQFNAREYAEDIFIEHTAAMLGGVTLNVESAFELSDHINKEVAYILCTDLFNKKITVLEYNAVRNELTTILDEIFKDAFKNEIEDEFDEEKHLLEKVE